MGEGIKIQNYATSNTNQGLIEGNAPAFHIFAGWLRYDYSTLPRNNAKNIKACIAQIQDYQKKFIEVKETLNQEMEKRIGKLEEIKKAEEIVKLEEEVINKEILKFIWPNFIFGFL